MMFAQKGYDEIFASEAHLDRALSLLRMSPDAPQIVVDKIREVNVRFEELHKELETYGIAPSRRACDS